MSSNSKISDIKNLSKEIDESYESNSIHNLNYLYPNGHRKTPQMKWFKGSRDRGLKSDLAAWILNEDFYLLIAMNKYNSIYVSDPDPYENIVKIEKLDPYQTLINSFLIQKQRKESDK